MKLQRAFRFQLQPRPCQARAMARFAGGLRWVWNQALAEQRRRHEAGLPYEGYCGMARWLTAWRNAPATTWLAAGPVHPQQQTLKRLDESYRRFMKADGGRPRFKRRGEEPGIRYPDPKQFRLDATNGRVSCPKLGWLRLRLSREVPASIRNLSLTREGERWFVSLQIERELELAPIETAPTLGLDMGTTVFAAGSDETLIEPLKALQRQARRVARHQRRMARKVRGSSNYRRVRDRFARLQRRIALQRRDWLHQLSTRLADVHPVMALEDLRVKCMSASARGTAAAPGKNVRQKAGLNRSILDQGWAEFRRQLEYKTHERGGRVFAVTPAYTSQRCRICGHTSAQNRRAQDQFQCVACGHAEHADIHAAKNILAAGHAAWVELHARSHVCGGKVQQGHPAKQLPTEARSGTCRLPNPQ